MRTTIPRLALLLSLATTAAACGTDVFSPSEEEARAAAEAKWAARPFINYQMEIRIDCQCQNQIVTAWHEVSVINGVISLVTPVAGGPAVDTELHALWSTIENVFDDLRGPHPNENVIDIRAQYDAELGYPTQADFIYEGLFSDATRSIFIRNVGPVN